MQQTLGLRAPTTPPKETAPEPSTSVPTTPPKETARAQQQCANNAAEGGGDWSTSGTQGHSLATDGGNDGYRLATYGGNDVYSIATGSDSASTLDPMPVESVLGLLLRGL